jgi:hypothetical protein
VAVLASLVLFEHLTAAKWLREQSAEWPTAVAERRWHRSMVEWAISEGLSSSNTAIQVCTTYICTTDTLLHMFQR